MLGKVVGVGLMGLLQMVLVGAAGLGAVAATGALTIPRLGLAVVAGGLLWFVLGFLLYALLYAAGAALVSRQEDVASVTTPITMVVVATYLAVFWVVGSPDNPLAVLLSVLPPLAPVLMPVRIASGDAQLWQVALAAVLTVATIAGLNFGAGRIYANSVLRTGTRVRLRDAWSGPA
jgi:ABC-2 type transport system permease protein